MTKKIRVTKTTNPLHFEDLEPHRFEDLVRRLLYGFRDWSNIEATGRSGADEGFDVRAWEKGETVTNVSEEGEEGSHTVEGRLWQIQGKREKAITPAKMRALIREGVSNTNPPYGYILAAATNISKTTYDAFREELRKKGVTELYFWGKDYLEDQLALPGNDEILFTFFGISLSPRRRSRITEIKFNLNNKNKILKLLFGREDSINQGVPQHKTFLLRDVKAEQYPDKSEYPDFDKNRRWEEHDAIKVTPTGVFFRVREWYAYFDEAKKELDVSTAVDLTPRKHNIDRTNELRLEDAGKIAERFWRHLPRRYQAKIRTFGFVPFEDMLIIDERGDPEHTDPHIFIDFGTNGPFRFIVTNIFHRREPIGEDELRNFKRIKVFPTKFPEDTIGETHDLESLGLNSEATRNLIHLRGPATFYAFDDQLKALAVGSVIRLPKRDQSSYERYAEVTYIFNTTVREVLKTDGEYYRTMLQANAGREITDDDEVTVYELFEVMLPYNEGGQLTYLENERGW